MNIQHFDADSITIAFVSNKLSGNDILINVTTTGVIHCMVSNVHTDEHSEIVLVMQVFTVSFTSKATNLGPMNEL